VISFDQIGLFIESHPITAPLIVLVFRFIGAIVPPIPSAAVAFASLLVMPWWEALLVNLIGSDLGAAAAFLIARRFREPVVVKFVALKQVLAWQEKVSQAKQLMAFAGLRAATLMAFDFVSYAAGLSALPFRIFIVATLIVDIPINIAFFYFGGIVFQYSMYLFAALCATFLLFSLWLQKNYGKVQARPTLPL